MAGWRGGYGKTRHGAGEKPSQPPGFVSFVDAGSLLFHGLPASAGCLIGWFTMRLV